jgi:hypothetical protein
MKSECVVLCNEYVVFQNFFHLLIFQMLFPTFITAVNKFDIHVSVFHDIIYENDQQDATV